MATPAKEITMSLPDRLTFKQFFEAIGGVEGYLTLRHQSPALCRQMMKTFNISLDDLPKEEKESK